MDGLQYRFNNEICWTWSKPEEFYNRFIRDELKFKIYSFRKCGQPKLTKPKELKGIKRVFSVNFIDKRCRCQCFIKNNDVWIKHRDYFSPVMEVKLEDRGTPLSYRAKKYLNKHVPEKFGYPDTWGAIVERQEAWILIKNLVSEIKSGKFQLDIVNNIREQQEKYHRFKKNELVCSDMERFWENVVKKLVDYNKQI